MPFALQDETDETPQEKRRRRLLMFPTRTDGLPDLETGRGTFSGLPDRATMREGIPPEEPVPATAPAASPEDVGELGYFAPPVAQETAPAPVDRFGFGNIARIQAERPKPENYRPSKWRRFGAALAAGAARFGGPPGSGTRVGEQITGAPLRQAMGDWESRLESAQGVSQAEVQKFGMERQATADTRGTQEFDAKMAEHKERSTLTTLQTDLARKQLANYVTPEQAVTQRKAWLEKLGASLAPDVAEAYVLTGQLKPDKTIDQFEFYLKSAGGDINKARELWEAGQAKIHGGAGGDKMRTRRSMIEQWKAKQYAGLEADIKDPNKKRSTTPEAIAARKREIENSYRAQKLAIGDEVDEGGAAPTPAAAPVAATGGMVRVVSPDGVPGTIPREDLERALAKGYKQIP